MSFSGNPTVLSNNLVLLKSQIKSQEFFKFLILGSSIFMEYYSETVLNNVCWTMNGEWKSDSQRPK